MANTHTHTWMGEFGHESCKPTLLAGDHPSIRSLRRKLTEATREHIARDNPGGLYYSRLDSDRKRVYGCKSKMKLSSAYPRQFAVTFLEHHKSGVEQWRKKLEETYDCDSDSDYDFECNDTWDDLKLDELKRDSIDIWCSRGVGCDL